MGVPLVAMRRRLFGTASWRVVNEGSLGRLIGVASAMKGWFVWPHGVGGNEGMIVWPRGINRMPTRKAWLIGSGAVGGNEGLV